MTRFEYKVDLILWNGKHPTLEEEFNARGGEGWRVIDIFIRDGFHDYATVTLEREVPEPTKPPEAPVTVRGEPRPVDEFLPGMSQQVSQTYTYGHDPDEPISE